MKKRITTSIKIDPDILDHSKINPNIKNLSDWINNAYSEKFMNYDFDKLKIEELQAEIDRRKKSLELIKSANYMEELSPIMISWLRDVAPGRLKDYPDRSAIVRLFNHTYGLSLNVRQFNYYYNYYNKSEE